MRKIQIPFETGKVIEYMAQPLCKLVEAEVPYFGCLNLVVLERWGDVPAKQEVIHKVLILEIGQEFEMTLPYEYVLSRRGKFRWGGGREYYIFQL